MCFLVYILRRVGLGIQIPPAFLSFQFFPGANPTIPYKLTSEDIGQSVHPHLHSWIIVIIRTQQLYPLHQCMDWLTSLTREYIRYLRFIPCPFISRELPTLGFYTHFVLSILTESFSTPPSLPRLGCVIFLSVLVL